MRCPTIGPIRWLQAPELVESGFPLSVMEPTGEIQRKSRTATYKGMTFTVTPSALTGERLTVSGSLHKYHTGGFVNTDRFTLANIQVATADLATRFGIEPESTQLENVEVGVNLSLPFSPARVLRSAVAYRGQPYCALNPRKPTIGKLCSMADYEIKLYDKGKQTGNQRANLLRVEVRVRKMRYLQPYGIETLADLTDPAKVRPLVAVLLGIIDGTVFIDPTANTERLTPSERETYLRLLAPDAWNANGLGQRLRNPDALGANDAIRKQRQYYRQQLPILLEKCKAFDYAHALRDLVATEWQALCDEGQTPGLNRSVLPSSEAGENLTFAPLECVGENVRIGVSQTLDKSSIYFLPEIEKNRVCITCGKPLIGQKPGSRFCSEKYNGSSAARRCRNQDSNRRRTKRNQIMKAKKDNHFLRISYTHEGQAYTDTLHSSEVTVSRDYLDKVTSVETLKGCPGKDLFESVCSGKCNNCNVKRLASKRAQAHLSDLTAQNAPDATDSPSTDEGVTALANADATVSVDTDTPPLGLNVD